MNNETIKRIFSSLILIPIVCFFIFKGSLLFTIFILFIFLITIYEWHLLSSKRKYYLPGIIFIIFSFFTVHNFRIYGDFSYFLLILVTCIATDIGGYTFGKTFNGPKLTKISPKKTYAGMLGSFLLSIIFSYIYLNNLETLKLNNTIDYFDFRIIFTILLVSLVSQIGDLIVSFFKRKSKIKNTGKIIPGHGGILDRIDGMIFAFPFIFLLLKFL